MHAVRVSIPDRAGVTGGDSLQRRRSFPNRDRVITPQIVFESVHWSSKVVRFRYSRPVARVLVLPDDAFARWGLFLLHPMDNVHERVIDLTV